MPENLFSKETELLERSQASLKKGVLEPDLTRELIVGYKKLLKQSRRLVRFNDRSETKLNDARKTADDANRAKAEFLATMSHEIRTPMNGVVGMIDLLHETTLDADQRKMMKTVRDSAFSLLQIINDILDFSKIEAGKMEIENVSVSIRDVVEGAADTLQPNAAAKGVKLGVYIDPKIPDWVLGDEVRLRQILFNLGGNAIKFTENNLEPQGRVMIRAERVGRETKKDVKIRFSIEDTGVGISESAQAQLFAPFTQAESSTTRRFGGTGLGLSICRNLTDLMRGEIGVISEEGVGSTFTVELPFDKDPTPPMEIDEPDLSGLRVLASIPDEDAHCVVQSYLEHHGCELHDAPDLQSLQDTAIESAQSGSAYDLIIISSYWSGEQQEQTLVTLHDGPYLTNPSFVVLTENRTAKKRLVHPNTVVVEAFPLRRSTFLRGVAMATGRISPDFKDGHERITADARKTPSIEAALAEGSLILVAEDNLTNQDVIRRQVNILGYACEIADDGQQALNMWKSKQYAILLTDCHMPEMDGYQLTREIRKTEAKMSAGARIPIVAITASAFESEREGCLEAGMDDYLTKPLEMSKLKQAIANWMPELDTLADASSKPVQAPNTTKEVGNESDAIDSQALMDVFGDDMETFREILQDFVEPSKMICKEIEQAFVDRDAAAVGAAAHKLKSSSRAVGANELADLCAALEIAGKDGNWKAIEGDTPHLSNAMQRVTAYIENV